MRKRVGGSTFRSVAVCWLLGVSWLLCGHAAGGDTSAQEILDATGVRGGLIVHVGCGDGQLTSALGAGEGFLVHGLDADAGNVEKARATIRAAGRYGKVSVEQFTGERLPYAENMENLVVSEDIGKVSMDEVTRVLVPDGVAYVRKGGAWTKTVKPRPKEIDEWTHWLHDAGNNATARDTRVGPPKRMQWVAEPLWSRGHEVPSSVGGVVTAHGRIFYALDEGQTGIYALPAKWTLVARDAFNGVLLWKRPLPHWGPAISFGGFGNGFRPRRLVTDGDRVYLPMGQEAILTALDAATGKTLKELGQVRGTTEILCDGGLVVAVTSPQAAEGPAGKGGAPAGREAVVAEAESLDVLWKAPLSGIAPQTTALSGGRVFLKAGNDIVALDAGTGKEAWRTPWKEAPAGGAGRASGAALMVHGGTVYVQGGGRLTALAAETGKARWERTDAPSSKGELFAAAGLLWRTRGSNVVGHDPATGEVRKTIDASDVFSPGHHLRCYRNKATERYVITNNRGAEFVSLTSDEHVGNDWVRGNCGHGVMPANGLLYAPPCQCFCYPGEMLTGFKALGPGPVPAPSADPVNDASRLERGPAYEDIRNPQSAIADEGDWPMYRRNAARRCNGAACPEPVEGHSDASAAAVLRGVRGIRHP